MQLHALKGQQWVFVAEANKTETYTCPECAAILRLRSGPQRHPHFFHLHKTPSCRLAQKGAVHLQIQKQLQDKLSHLGACMEYRFPAINRIADIACLGTPIPYVIEIQCSPISLDEAIARSSDYFSQGITPVWVLHDSRFHQKKVGRAEYFLRKFTTCYFTNIDASGEGIIYDAWGEDDRKLSETPFTFFSMQAISLAHPLPLPKKQTLPPFLRHRFDHSLLHFSGDTLDLYLQKKNRHHLFFSMTGWSRRLWKVFLFFLRKTLRC